MKTLHAAQPQRKAFTLIELLVVIAIISILMALLFPAINGAKLAAQKTQARSDITGIVASVKHYYADYGKYPVIPTGGKTVTTTDVGYGTSIKQKTNADLFMILRAIASGGNAADVMNPRKVVYFEGSDVKNVSDPRGGFIPITGSGTSTIAEGALVDPWGYEYAILMDGNYDNILQLTAAMTTPYTDTNKKDPRVGAAGISVGKDGGLGTKGNNTFLNSDDIISW